MHGEFDYGGSGQGFGYRIDIEFVRLFMEVFRVERLRDVNGKYCWVTHTGCQILKVEPMLPRDGQAFDVLRWSKDAQDRAALLRAV